MAKVAIGIGSNIGDRLSNMRKSVKMISGHAGAEKLLAASDVYETPPWGLESQPRFLNACILVETAFSPHKLLRALKEIERALGRTERERWGPREIDLDILLWEGIEVCEHDLSIPHPHLAERAFVLVPLAQIAPRLKHPALGKTIAELLDDLPEGARVARSKILRITGL